MSYSNTTNLLVHGSVYHNAALILVVPIGKCQRAKYACLFVRTDTEWFSIELYNLK